MFSVGLEKQTHIFQKLCKWTENAVKGAHTMWGDPNQKTFSFPSMNEKITKQRLRIIVEKTKIKI